MTQLHRFHVPGLAGQPEFVTLPDDEMHHAIHVVRVRTGDSIQLFDGAGRWCDAQVVGSGRRKFEARRGPIHEEQAGAATFVLAQAWLNREKSNETVIQRGTELGVDRFVFFRAQHSGRAPTGHDKWMRWAVESCKQCVRNRLPEFVAVADLAAGLARCAGHRLIVATQHANPTPLARAVTGAGRVCVLVGPEGDFTAEEVDLALRSGACAVSLGPLTLRAELAAIVAIALIQHQLGRLGP